MVRMRSMRIECIFFGPFREDVGEKTVFVEPSDETVGTLLEDLESSYPVLEGRLIDHHADDLAGKTVVTKNKTDVRHLEGLETTLSADDVVRLVPSVYGGTAEPGSRR